MKQDHTIMYHIKHALLILWGAIYTSAVWCAVLAYHEKLEPSPGWAIIISLILVLGSGVNLFVGGGHFIDHLDDDEEKSD